MKSVFRVSLILFALLLGACNQTGNQIGSNMDFCCPGSYPEYEQYRLEFVDLPLFLRNYVDQEFEMAMLEKGLRRDDRINDLRVVLTYNHINLDPQQQEINPFERIESLNIELSYVAEIKVEMFETSTNNKVWGGSISRIHHVTPGEYMHEDQARPEFRNAFRELLAGYPGI